MTYTSEARDPRSCSLHSEESRVWLLLFAGLGAHDAPPSKTCSIPRLTTSESPSSSSGGRVDNQHSRAGSKNMLPTRHAPVMSAASMTAKRQSSDCVTICDVVMITTTMGIQIAEADSSVKPLTPEEIDALYAKQKAFRVAIHAAMNAVPDIEIPAGASETEITELDTLLFAQIRKVATPFMQDFRDWRDSLTLPERQALHLEMTPEREAYIDEHVADVCGA